MSAQHQQQQQQQQQLYQQQQQQQQQFQQQKHQQFQQPQQQQQQQQAQQQQQQQQQPNHLLQPNVGPPPPNQSPAGNITLPQVLHYLQSTHRTHLSLQNSWEIERAELRARVALLEGEKRSWEQAKTDLARRVRMLEWALKMERSKYLSHNPNNKENTNAFTMALPPGKLAALRMAENGAGQASGSDSPARADSPKYDEQNAAPSAARPTGPAVVVSDATNPEQSPPANPPGNLPPATSSTAPTHSISIAPPLPAVAAQNMARIGTNNNGNANTWANGMTGAGMATMMGGTGIGFGTTAMGIGRDPKARARSRDYLKQCLQEINYLTSNPVLNPLPQQSALIPGIERPRKILNENQGVQQAHPNQANHQFQAGSNVHQQTTNNQHQQQSPNPIHRPLNHPAGLRILPNDRLSIKSRRSTTIINNNRIHDTCSKFSRPLLITSMSSNDNNNNNNDGSEMATGSSSTIPSSLPLTVANLPILSPPDHSPLNTDSSSSIGDGDNPGNNAQSQDKLNPNGIVNNPNGISDPISQLPPRTIRLRPTKPSTITIEEMKKDFHHYSSKMIHLKSKDREQEILDHHHHHRHQPDSSESWKEQLRLAGEKEKIRLSKLDEDDPTNLQLLHPHASRNDLHHGIIKADEELAGLSLNDHLPSSSNNSINPANLTTTVGDLTKNSSSSTSTGAVVQKNFDGYKVWKPKKTLRSHLDAARCIAFDRYGLAIVSGSDDCTVKLWRLNPASIANPSPSSWPETEPQITYRGHSATITSVAISSSPPRIYSASLDSVVSVWTLPPAEHETYAPYDPRSLLATFVGHTDAIWDMVLLPLRLRDEALLATVSADGTVKVWSTDELKSPLKLSWGYHGYQDESSSSDDDQSEKLVVKNATGNSVNVTPTSVAVVWSDLKKVAVSYTNSVIKLFELESGKVSLRLKSDESFDGSTATQINKIVTHPTLPLLISAHEDRFIRLYDLNTGGCTHSMLGHLDSVTSLSIDPTGLILVSGGHDCSIRFWDLTGSRTCLQEISSHRYKSNQEGVLDVKFHPSSNLSSSSNLHLPPNLGSGLSHNSNANSTTKSASLNPFHHLKFVASSGADGTIKIFG
ncbi:hypothetical protein KEM48_012192 [Puccinia striiformis f. sp. tritici PST-130]|nr:hypothetical protein KEM48_012192 [Puccinia striiformis f. sp. tritici PST-130]